MSYLVRYSVVGFGAQSAGPYDTLDEARMHADDIRGYDGVHTVEIEKIADSAPAFYPEGK